MSLYDALPSFNPETNDLNAVVDTPKGSRNKYSYRDKTGLFELSGVLPLGAVFPFDFGFIPQTLGGDGDPLNVLVLIDSRLSSVASFPLVSLGFSKRSRPRRATPSATIG